MSTEPVIAIVDDPGTAHGQLMRTRALAVAPSVGIEWVLPDLDLPARLHHLRGVRAVAVPLVVRQAGPRDRFTGHVGEALAALQSRGIPSFVAEARPGTNPLGRQGTPCAAPRGDGAGASGACVEAAARFASGNVLLQSPQPTASTTTSSRTSGTATMRTTRPRSTPTTSTSSRSRSC